MPKVTEMLCMFCSRSMTTTSPVCEEDDTVQDYIAISQCLHLMHMSCYVYANLVTCRYPKCDEVIDRNRVVVNVEVNLKDGIVETSDVKCIRLGDLPTGLNLATTSNLELTTRLKVAEDKLAEHEANAKVLMLEAEKRTSEAKAAELDAKKRYELVVGKLRNHLIACRCTASAICNDPLFNTSVPLLPPNELSPLSQMPYQTSPAAAPTAPFSGSNNTFLPCSESIEGPVPKGKNDMSMKSSLQHHVRDPRLRLSSKKLIEKPISKFMLSDKNANHSPPSTSSESSIADKAGASRHSRSSGGYRRKMTAQIFAREDRSPAAKRWKSASESNFIDYNRYWLRFGVTPPTLKNFFPMNSFPMGYTVAGIQDVEKVCKVAILAYDALLLGDGHALGIANYVVKNKPFKDLLFECLYRRDLSIVDLITTLDRFTMLPAKIILSIGNWDAIQNMQSEQFLAHFKTLLLIFKKCRVKVLYILPIIFYPGMGLNREFIAGCLNTDWGKTFGGQYELLSEMVSRVINVQLSVIDDKGPVYELDEYASLVEAIRDRFIPVAAVEMSSGRQS